MTYRPPGHSPPFWEGTAGESGGGAIEDAQPSLKLSRILPAIRNSGQGIQVF